MSNHEKHDPKLLALLWKLDYEQLVMAPGEVDGCGFTEARFVLQAKVALETRSLIRSTFWMAVGTFVLAVATIAVALIAYITHGA
jgi:hypothetical protein